MRRLSYIPLYIDQIYRFFEPVLIDATASTPENFWLEFEGVPLKWWVPPSPQPPPRSIWLTRVQALAHRRAL